MYVNKHNNKLLKVWMDESEFLDDKLLVGQIENVANLPMLYKWVSLMPDGHLGYGMPIGGVAALDGFICSNMVGVDIACGMRFARLPLKWDDIKDNVSIEEILNKISDAIPTGFSHNKNPDTDFVPSAAEFNALRYIGDEIEVQKIIDSSLGTLGGGNHFIALQVDSETNDLCIMLHSGSRGFGYKIAKTYNKLAQKSMKENYSWMADEFKDLAFFRADSRLGQDYLCAMNCALDFAKKSRLIMMDKAVKATKDIISPITRDVWLTKDNIDVHHNYASLENHFGKNVWVHRKGAISARKDEIGIIPSSMATPSYIVKGKGNVNSFCSASHGAGRAMGRKEAKRQFTEDMAKSDLLNANVITLSKSGNIIEESPRCYKDIKTVMDNQSDLVEIVSELIPLGNLIG